MKFSNPITGAPVVTEEFKKKLRQAEELLANCKTQLPELQKLLDEMNHVWRYEDLIYRFYYQSFKVYHVQGDTQSIVSALRGLAPKGKDFCREFREILDLGAAGKKFEMEHNKNWTAHTRPFLEAFFHAKFFLEMAVKYGKELESAPETIPSGWAALLCLYDIR